MAHRPAAQGEDTSAAAGHAGDNGGETFPNFSCLLETPAPSQDAAEWGRGGDDATSGKRPFLAAGRPAEGRTSENGARWE